MIPHLHIFSLKQWHLCFFFCFRSRPSKDFFTLPVASLDWEQVQREGPLLVLAAYLFPWTRFGIWRCKSGFSNQLILELAHIKQTTIPIKWHLHQTVLPLLLTWSTSAGCGKPGTGIVSRSVWSAFQGEDTGICLLAHVEAAGKILAYCCVLYFVLIERWNI